MTTSAAGEEHLRVRRSGVPSEWGQPLPGLCCPSQLAPRALSWGWGPSSSCVHRRCVCLPSGRAECTRVLGCTCLPVSSPPLWGQGSCQCLDLSLLLPCWPGWLAWPGSAAALHNSLCLPGISRLCLPGLPSSGISSPSLLPSAAPAHPPLARCAQAGWARDLTCH